MKIPVLLSLLLPLPLAAAVIPVTTISDLPAKVASAGPGDTVQIADGVYANVGTLNLVPGTSGTSTNVVKITAQDPGQVIFTGTTTLNLGQPATSTPTSYVEISGLRFDSAINASGTQQDVVAFNDAQNCRLTECAFINCGNLATTPGSAGTTVGTTAHIIGVYSGSQYLRIDHNYFKGGYSQSISFVINGKPLGFTNSQSGPWHWIDHNAFVDIEPMAGNGQEPVQVGQSAIPTEMHVMVEWNLWDDASGDTEFFSFKTSDNTARFNTFRDGLINYGTLSLRYGNDNTVDGNFVYSPAIGINAFGSNQTITNNYIQDFVNGFSSLAFGPIGLAQGTSEATNTQAQPARRTLVANNTIVNFSGALVGGIVLGTANYSTGTIPEGTANVHAAENVVINNLIQSSQGTLIDNLASDTTTYGGDFTYNSGSATAGVTGSGITALTATPFSYDTTGVIPLYRLYSPDAVIGQGVTVPAAMVPPEDMDGQARTSADPGSDEYSGAGLARRPALITDVGPAWMGRTPPPPPTIALPEPVPVWGPTALTASAFNPTTIHLVWSGGSATTGYQYRIHEASAAWSIPTAAFAAGSATDALITVEPNHQYFFQVRALGSSSDGSDASAWSPIATVVAPLGYAAPATTGTPGALAIEAEDYTTLVTSTSCGPWAEQTSVSGYRGLGYMLDSSDPATSTWSTASGMDYVAYFPAVGTYTLFARAYATDTASDSLFWSTDGVPSATPIYVTIESPLNWTWVNFGTFSVTATTHLKTINIRRREPRLLIDRIYATMNGDTPTGDGPAEGDFLERPLITSSPADALTPLKVKAGSTTTLTAAAFGNPAPSYQWETVAYGSSTTANNETSTPISGATGASYTTPAATASTGGFYDVIASNVAGSATSPTFNLGVVVPPTLVSSPSGGTVSAGTAYTFTATGDLPGWNGGATWLFNGSAIAGGPPVYPASPGSGPTMLTFTIANVTPAYAGTYAVKLSDDAGTVTSSPVTLTVTGASGSTPVFTTQPTSVVATVGQTPSSISFTAAASNSPHYQWYRNGVAIAGATSATYTLSVPVADLPPYGRIATSPNFGVQGTYTVQASNTEGSVTSHPAFLLIKRVEDQSNRGNVYPAAASVKTGNPILLSFTADAWNDGSTATATVINPTMQWYKSGTAISGATLSSLYIPAAAASDAATYSVQLTYTDPTTAVSASETISLVTLTVH